MKGRVSHASLASSGTWPFVHFAVGPAGEVTGGSKVKAMGNRIRSSVSQYPRQSLKSTSDFWTFCSNITTVTSRFSQHAVILCFTVSVCSDLFPSLVPFPRWPLVTPSLPPLTCVSKPSRGQCKVASMFVLFCFLHLFLLLSSLTPISGCCESEGAIKTETQSSQP